MTESLHNVSHVWAGNIYGTNTGKVFLELKQDGDDNTGILRVNDDTNGIYVYEIAAKFEDGTYIVTGTPEADLDQSQFGDLTAELKILGNGTLQGQWSTTLKSGGTIRLFPHENKNTNSKSALRLHTKRHTFSAIRISAPEILKLAEKFQQEFDEAKVIITVVGTTEISFFLEDFKSYEFDDYKAEFLKIHVQRPESEGISRVLSLQFGETENVAVAQSSDETWAIGRIAKLAKEIEGFESKVTTRFGGIADWVSSIILLLALIYLPSIEDIYQRGAFLAGVVMILLGSGLMRKKYIVNAVIYLTNKKIGFFERHTPRIISWTASIVASVLTAWLVSFFT